MTDGIAYTPEDVAKILKISRFTVYELIKRGELSAYRIGRKVRVEPADLEKYKLQAKTRHAHIEPELVGQYAERPLAVSEELIICGQDIVLDMLTRQLERQMPEGRVLRRYIGSIDGLQALYRGTANLVTAHLWDSDTDEYNTPYVRRMLPGQRTVLVNLVYRTEGFYVKAGNPLGIKDWSDLTRPDIRFVNRECGSGARVLLDEQLRLLGLDGSAIKGYIREESSHLAVASCVARGEGDVGLGIENVAPQVKDVDFIPLKKERYDLVMRKTDQNRPQFRVLLEILRGQAFRSEVGGMAGYDVSRMGEIMAEL